MDLELSFLESNNLLRFYKNDLWFNMDLLV